MVVIELGATNQSLWVYLATQVYIGQLRHSKAFAQNGDYRYSAESSLFLDSSFHHQSLGAYWSWQIAPLAVP